MKGYKHVSGPRKLAVMALSGALFAGTAGCELGDFTTTTTTTLSAEEVVTYFVRSLLITPIDNFITERVEGFFAEEDD